MAAATSPDHVAKVPPADTQSALRQVRWELRSDWQMDLIGPHGLRLQEWLRDGIARVVKQGEHRLVYRVDLPRGTVFLKHYRCRSWLAAVRNLVRRSISRREMRSAQEVLRRQLPTAVPVGIGEQRRGGLVRDSFFITEAIPESHTLDEFLATTLPSLPPAEAANVRRQLIDQLARLSAQLHRTGVEHLDFHAGNILVRCVAEARHAGEKQAGLRPCLYLIDLPKIRLSGPLNWRKSRRSLAMLLGGLLTRTTLRERWQFWKAYRLERPDLVGGDSRLGAEEVLHLAWEQAFGVLASRDRRCLANNRDFYGLSAGNTRGHAVRSVPQDQLAAVMRDPESPLREFWHQPLKISHSSLMVRATLVENGSPVEVAYKRFRVKHWWKALIAWLRPGRALRAWQVGHALLQRGIATPRPLLVCQQRFSRNSYLATEWIPGGENLHLFLWRIASLPPRQRDRLAAQCARSLGTLLARLHTWRISHRDLKACNLLVAGDTQAAGDAMQAWLVDLDGVTLHKRLSAARRAQDLARLAVSLEMHAWISRTLRLQFVRCYLRELQPAADSLRRLWPDVRSRAERLLLDLRRRGRPVA